MPAIKRRPKAGGSGTAAGSRERASVAEIEAALQKAIRMGSGRAYKTLNDLVQKVSPSDIPEAAGLRREDAFREPSSPSCASLLLAHWAETDVSAAMAYADKVSGYQDRQQAILTVLRAWAEKDAEAATAWAQQLPAGQLRKQALSTVSLRTRAEEPGGGLRADDEFDPGERRWGMTS